jgi:hypothetical protein
MGRKCTGEKTTKSLTKSQSFHYIVLFNYGKIIVGIEHTFFTEGDCFVQQIIFAFMADALD